MNNVAAWCLMLGLTVGASACSSSVDETEEKAPMADSGTSDSAKGDSGNQDASAADVTNIDTATDTSLDIQPDTFPESSSTDTGASADSSSADSSMADTSPDTKPDSTTDSATAKDSSADAPDSAASDGVIQFVGDWETQDTSQWTNTLFRDKNKQFQIVNSPLRQGSYAAKFTVRPGDKYKTFSGQRGEVSIESNAKLWERSGDDLYYGWSTYFPSDWKEPKGWAIFCQWHAFTSISPPIGFKAKESGITVDFNTGDITSWWPAEYGKSHVVANSLSKGKWNDFIVRIKWKPDWTGLVEVWHRVEGQGDFKLALSLKDIPTMQWTTNKAQFWESKYANDWGKGWYSNSYLQYGFYRGDEATITNVVYQDGFARGTGYGVIRNRFK